MPQLIDLSHTVEHGMITYNGLPAPVISDYWSRADSRTHYAPGTEFQIGKIEMVGNTGTYLDSPFHRYANGSDLADLPLQSIANLEGVVVRWDMSNGRAVGVDALKTIDVQGKAVLIHTGWDAHWRTERYFRSHPYLTCDAAQWLVDHQAALVGIDSLNIDSTEDGTRPAHTLLLGANIPIVEHLCNLRAIPEHRFRFFAVPVKIKRMSSFPVRAFALIE
jgi:arylformamidase